MISLSHVTKNFGLQQAVSDLSLTIKKGEIVGFLGPNGAGKTTTMRMITGYLTQDSGDITVNAIPVATQPQAVQKLIGYLPENNPLYKDMLVSELLTYSAHLKGMSNQETKEAFDFVVSSVGIADVFYRPIAELSKGYKQRVGIAIAILNQPQVIIMDEPTEGLDPNQRTEIRALIKKLAKNHTIIMSTHVMQEAQAVANRLIIIAKGSVVADGSPATLLQKGKKNTTLSVELEGKNIKEILSKAKGITIVETKKSGKDRLVFRLESQSADPLPPKINALARSHHFIIWKLIQEEHNLEDVFHQLTQEEAKT